jgi:hypothetical protein
MKSFTLFLIGVMLSSGGCTPTPLPRIQLMPGARIGILSLLENQMTHEHLGALWFDSFRKGYPLDWDLGGYASAYLSRELKYLDRVAVLVLPSPADPEERARISRDIYSTITSRSSADLKQYLEKLAAANQLDVIVTISTYAAESRYEIATNPIRLQGYGLFTRTSMLSDLHAVIPLRQDESFAYAHIAVAVFRAQPCSLAGWGAPDYMKSPIRDFPWPHDIRHLDVQVFNVLKPLIQGYAAEACKRALQNSGLYATP